MVKIETVIQSLSGSKVEYVIVGGVAINAHSSAYVTFDFDFCYARTTENLECIVKALAEFNPRPRNFPAELPFSFDISFLRNGTNFTFESEIGDIDMLGEVSGIGGFQEVLEHSEVFPLYGFDVRILSIKGLIKAKRAAGRTKDLLVLPELEALQEALSEEE
jgi:hypothetical protein